MVHDHHVWVRVVPAVVNGARPPRLGEGGSSSCVISAGSWVVHTGVSSVH